MKKKIIFFLVLFVTLSSSAFSHSDKIFFYDDSTSLILSYKIEKHPSESIVIFNITDIFSYYKWRRFDKSKFHQEMENIISKSNEYNNNDTLNILIKTNFFFFKGKIIYSERYRLNRAENMQL